MGQCAAHQPHEMEAKCSLDKNMGEETSAVLSELAALLKRTNEDIFKTPMKHSSLINLGMISTKYARERYSQPPSSGKKFTDTALLRRGVRYARYAKAARCSESEEILKAVLGDDEDEGKVDILHVDMAAGAAASNLGKVPAGFFIAADKATGEIVLSIRGTATAQEAIGSIAAETTPFMDGSAPKALLASSKEMMKRAKEPLESALKDSPGSSFAVVGHGMGAGLAVLATLQGFGEGSAVEPLLAGAKVKCYAFALPPIFEPIEKLPVERALNIYSFVNGMDCVPRASPATVGKLLLAVRKVDELDVDLPARLKFLAGEEDAAAEKLVDHEELPEELSRELKSLSRVGTTILLFKGKDGRMNCEELLPEQTDRILVHPDMAKDHAVAGYEESIAEMLMQLHRSKGCC